MIAICKCGSKQYKIALNRLLSRYQLKHSFATIFSFSSNLKKYNERRILGYSKQQLYDLVSGVEYYDQFVPNCAKSVVTQRSQNMIKADVVISIAPVFREQLSFNVSLVPPISVISESSGDSRVFKYLKSEWKFSDGLTKSENSCTIDYDIVFELKSQLHYHLVNIFFDHFASKTVDAFINRAQTLYGEQHTNNNNVLHKLKS